VATKSPSTNTSTSTNRCTISTKSCRKSTTSKPRPKGFLNKSSILGIHPYLGSGVALQHFLFGVRSRIATFSQQSTTEDRRKTTVFEARCCIATFSPVSPVGGTGRKIASGKYRKPYAGRDQRPETRDQRPETRDQRPRSGEEPRWDSGRLRGGLSRRWENQLQRFSPLSPLFQLHPGASFNLT